MNDNAAAGVAPLIQRAQYDLATGRAAEAVVRIRHAIGQQPRHAPPLLSLYRQALWQAVAQAVDRCDWTHYDLTARWVHEAIEDDPAFWMTGETCLTLDTLTRHDLRTLQERFCACFPRPDGSFAHRPPQQRIRIGIIGCDFHAQATAYLFTGVAERMDRRRVDLLAFDYGPEIPGEWRTRCVAAYDEFISIADMDDRAAAELIHARGIDVLIHMRDVAKGRLGICAWRPAAIQIQYLYFPGTSGAAFMDYLVADDVVVPPELEDGYVERILRMRGCYQPNDSARERPAPITRNEFGLAGDWVLLANFNQSYKITPAIFALWCQLLRRDDRRRLWLLDGGAENCSRLQQEAALHGIDPTRLIFAPRSSIAVHLARLACSDLVVDTYPYGGHTLTSDSLWAGTPVISLRGETFASRVAASLLTVSGLHDFIVDDPREYLSVADTMLNDRDRLQRWRRHLDETRAANSLFDPDDYAGRFLDIIEQAVRTRWPERGT